MNQVRDILPLPMQAAYERLLHKDGKFAAEFDPSRGVIRFVDRGGTVEYDLLARMVEARQMLDAMGAQNGDK